MFQSLGFRLKKEAGKRRVEKVEEWKGFGGEGRDGFRGERQGVRGTGLGMRQNGLEFI